MDLQLDNKIALVTGSNRGTGQIIAQSLALEGATVVFHSIEAGPSEAAANGINHALYVWGDITTEPGCQQLLDQDRKSVV